VRIAQRIGLGRISRDITPTLDEYLRQREAESDAAQAERTRLESQE